MLSLVGTPIGNLEDLSFRALRILKECDYVLCEDTRKSQILFYHYGIEKKLISYHKFNEKEKEILILKHLKEGKRIALICDSGMPGICDPGQRLVKKCLESGLPYEVIPGPCSVIQALVVSGMGSEAFEFVGFLPKKAGELEKRLKWMLAFCGSSIAFETPHRIVQTLKMLKNLDAEREFCIVREMTKKFEECLCGNAEELLQHFAKHEPKGEMVLLIPEGNLEKEKLNIKEMIALLQEHYAMSLKEAIVSAAKISKIPKREIYQTMAGNDDLTDNSFRE